MGHTDVVARRPGGLVGAAVLRRGARRRDLGPRRARHEEPGRGERGCDRIARARGLQAVAATSSSPRPPTRRSAPASASSGSARRIPMRCAPTSASTRAAATGSRSAARRTGSARSPRRCRRRSSSACAGARGTRRCRGSPTTRSSRRRALIERIASYRAAARRAARGRRRSSQTVGECRARRAAVRAIDRAELVEPLLAPTFSPTMISASQKRNIIPARLRDRPSTAGCCRDTTPARRRADIRARARRRRRVRDRVHRGARRHALRVRHAAAGTPLESFVAEVDPGARVAPMITAGFTDSHWLREAFGTVAYGFFPVARCRPS